MILALHCFYCQNDLGQLTCENCFLLSSKMALPTHRGGLSGPAEGQRVLRGDELLYLWSSPPGQSIQTKSYKITRKDPQTLSRSDFNIRPPKNSVFDRTRACEAVCNSKVNTQYSDYQVKLKAA
jgi:hypothetical protein